MKVLKARITSTNWMEAIPYCRKFAKKEGKDYEYAAELLNDIKKDRMIIHIYEDNNYEFKRIRSNKKEAIDDK